MPKAKKAPMPDGSRRRPHLRKPPKLAPTMQTQKVELIGMDEDGRMWLWSTGEVRPVTRFEDCPGHEGLYIDAGHYVIQWRGHAITVHCGNMISGLVSIQFMCSGGSGIQMPRAEVEAMLLGKVIPDPVVEARITQNLERLMNRVIASEQAPHRQRGRL